jgi:hypothetical protein
LLVKRNVLLSCVSVNASVYVGFEVSILLDVKSCSPLKINRRFGWICRLHNHSQRSQARKHRESRWKAELCLPLAFTQISCLVYSSNLKMEATCSSETSTDFKRTTTRSITKDKSLKHNLWWRSTNTKRKEFVKFISLFSPNLLVKKKRHTYIKLWFFLLFCVSVILGI